MFNVSKALALLRNKREALPLIHPGRFTKKLVERFLEHNKASPAVPQPLADNLTGDAGTVLAHRSTQIFNQSCGPEVMLKMIFKMRAFALQNEGVHRNPITATITNASVPTLILLIALVSSSERDMF
jgi:hypothetical protein